MFLLLYLRHRFLWWPIHPIGLPVGGTYVMFFAWSSMALGWLAKWIVLRYGGITLFRRLRPFFLGMVLGQRQQCGVVDGGGSDCRVGCRGDAMVAPIPNS